MQTVMAKEKFKKKQKKNSGCMLEVEVTGVDLRLNMGSGEE